MSPKVSPAGFRPGQNGFLATTGRRNRNIAGDVGRAMCLATAPVGPLTNAARAAQLTLILTQILDDKSTPQSNSSPSFLEDTLRWAEDHPEGLSISSLATPAGFSASHFRAVFTRRFGQSPGRFIHQMKVTEAKRLLRETREPLKAIAATLEYSDAVSFHHSFTALAGWTPAAYRQNFAPRG